MDINTAAVVAGLTVRRTGMVYPAGLIPVDPGVNHHSVIERKEKGVVRILGVVRRERLGLLPGDPLSGVFDDSCSLGNGAEGEDTPAVVVDLPTSTSFGCCFRLCLPSIALGNHSKNRQPLAIWLWRKMVVAARPPRPRPKSSAGRESFTRGYNSGRDHSRNAKVHLFFRGLPAGLQRGEAIGAKAALNSMGIERPLDFTEVNCDLAFIAGQANARNDVANGVGHSFFRQLIIELFNPERELPVDANHLLIGKNTLISLGNVGTAVRRARPAISRVPIG